MNNASYFKLDRNEHGKPFLFYKPSDGDRYSCWLPIDEEFYKAFSELQIITKERPSNEYTEGYKKGWSDCCKDVRENP